MYFIIIVLFIYLSDIRKRGQCLFQNYNKIRNILSYCSNQIIIFFKFSPVYQSNILIFDNFQFLIFACQIVELLPTLKFHPQP